MDKGIDSKAIFSFAVAAVLWFVMFSPWTSRHVNFWYMMTASGVILTSLAFIFDGRSLIGSLTADAFGTRMKTIVLNVVLGLLLAAVLWCVFWVCDKVSQMMFTFARPGVDSIYDMKSGTDPVIIGWLLLLIIGPAEEIFWRGFLQNRLMNRFGGNVGFVVATLCYTFIHVWSFNIMLILAAMVVGAIWGFIYRLFGSKSLPVLIISHAVWDAVAFVVFPF